MGMFNLSIVLRRLKQVSKKHAQVTAQKDRFFAMNDALDLLKCTDF